MDPQTAWNELLDSLAHDDLAEAELRAEALVHWLDRQGFAPQTCLRVLPGPWDEAICRYVCRKVMVSASVSDERTR